jgi:hypothetical protein
MDARDAYDILDSLAKEPATELTPAQEEALLRAEESAELLRGYRLRTRFDRRISELMSDVEVPAGLRERLLEIAQQPADGETACTSPDSSASIGPRRISRRSVIATLAGAAVAVAAALFFLFPSPRLGSPDVDRVVAELWNTSLQSFDGNFLAELPLGGWRSSHVRFDQDWSGAAVGERSRHDLAFKRFAFLSSRRVTHRGLLAALPASRLESKPGNYDPFTGEVRYLTTRDGSQYAIVSWIEREFDLVFFLALPAEENSLKALQDALSMPSA